MHVILAIAVFAVFLALYMVLFRIKSIEARKAKTSEELENLLPAIYTFSDEVNALKSSYISGSALDSITAKYADSYQKLSALNTHRKFILEKYTTPINNFIKDYVSMGQSVNQWNDSFIRNEKEKYADLFHDIDGKTLDDQQQTVVVTDEDNNLVLAGAGSGKTLTITAKVKYLCNCKNVSPEDILLIAFTKKSAEEMTVRMRDNLGIDIVASTFHKLGLYIITHAKGQRPDVADNLLTRVIYDYFDNKAADSPAVMRALIEYFAYYINIPSDMDEYRTLGEVFEHERSVDYETLKTKYNKEQFANIAAKEKRPAREALDGEKMKSIEEVMIANFLFLHGVNYEYERLYPFKSDDPYRKAYRPDFYLTDYDIYLEHFGIDKNGKLPWLSEIEEQKYVNGIDWKRKFHSKNGTKLIETYSYYNSDGVLLEKLEDLLSSNGVKFNEPDYKDVFTKVYGNLSNKYFAEFIKLCGTFITLFKSNGYKSDELEGLKYKSKEYQTNFHRNRTALFKIIIKPIIADYQDRLDADNAIDFSDMINTATELVKDGYKVHPYKYVIIDEYQDISMSRYRLVKAILEQTQAHLVCVGDDWQSIYRFAGSDISLFTDFEKYYGHSKIMKIEKTYRNSQQLIDEASKFVLSNPIQLNKKLSSDKTCNKPIEIIYFKNNPEKAIMQAVESIISEYGMEKSILLLGRTSYDEQLATGQITYDFSNANDALNIVSDKDIPTTQICMMPFICRDVTVKDEKGITHKKHVLEYYRNKRIPASFLTVHKSKGLEADNVIILNFNNELLGFPNKISDDPVLELVLGSVDKYMYAEERRLLYVALTRTRNRVFIITDVDHPSEFQKEFKESTSVAYSGVFETGGDYGTCPLCKTGHIVRRNNSTSNSTFLGCSNYPMCKYRVHSTDVLESQRCSCGGFFVKRKGPHGCFYGCSNYPLCRQTREMPQTLQYHS